MLGSILDPLRALARRFRPSTRDALGARDEQEFSAARGAVPIRGLKARQRARVCGVVRAVTYPAARGNGSFQVTVWDGTGAIDVYWLGRSDIQGISAGSHLVVSGVVAKRAGLLCFYNPTYELIA